MNRGVFLICFSCIAARLVFRDLCFRYIFRASLHGSSFETSCFYVQLKLYLLSCTDPHSFVRDRGAISIASQNDSQSGVWYGQIGCLTISTLMGTISFNLMGGQGGAITHFSLPSPAEYFSYFEGGGEAMYLLFHPTCFPIVPREGC